MAILSLRHETAVAVADVEAELCALDSPARSAGRNLLILLGSLVAFALLQAFSTTPSGIVVLIVVLLVHELGHLLAMKLFGYRDVRMFFIPLFGAAVAGSETSPHGTKRAMVALLGPTPGIGLGIASAVLFHSTKNPVFMQAARTFLILNTFNLLPFIPLDGGRYMEAVVFSRTPRLRALFDIGAGLGLAALAIALRSGLLGVIAFFVFRSVRLRYFSSRLAGQIKDEITAQDASEHGSAMAGLARERIPSEYVERLIPMLEYRLPEAARTPKQIAKEMRSIWNMVWFKAPSTAVSVGLVFLYLASFGVGLVATVGAEVSFLPPSARQATALHDNPAPQ